MVNTIRLLLANTEQEYHFAKPRILLGRNPDCDIVFAGVPQISRHHAEILIYGREMFIRDCDSVNGTFLNGIRLEPGREYPLKEGDEIVLAGNQKLRILEVLPAEAVVSAKREKYEETMESSLPGSVYQISEQFDSMPKSCARKMVAPTMPASPAFMEPPAPPAPSMSGGLAPMPTMPAPAPARAAAPAAKKGGFLRNLFGKKAQNTSKPDTGVSNATVPEQLTADDVQFRGTAPSTILPGAYFPVKIMMYREDDFERADRESAAVADKTKSASSSIFQAKRNQQFRIALQSPDLELDCGSQLLHWNGKYASADFEIYLPETYEKRQLRLRGRIYSGDAVLTDLKLILQIGEAQYGSIPCEKVRMRSAFISYASADRAKVVARIQGIQLACPDMDLFFDVESLRCGERWEERLYREISSRDLFYLFWSRNAANSDWVRKELEFALSKKTADYIEPIPLEGPETCPPPKSMADKHFNDWTLRYLANQ